MLPRLLLPTTLLLASCTQVERPLPACWENMDFAPGQPVTGRVTIMVGYDFPGDTTGISGLMTVSPITCENGSFGVLNPPARLLAYVRPVEDGDPLFGTAFEADIDATVRIIATDGHNGRISPFFLELRSIRDLRRIDRPRWWHWN